MRAAEVLTPYIAAQAILNVIGLGDGIRLILERNEASHRSEYLILRNLHPIVDIRKHRWPDEIAVAHRLRKIRSVGGPVDAATHQRGAFLRSPIYVAADLFEMSLADHGTHDGGFLQRVANTDAPGALNKAADKVSIDRALHQDSGPGCASFPVVGEDHEHRGIQSAGLVRIVENHKGALAAQLHAELLESSSAYYAIARR